MKHILFPTDFSDAANAAFTYALPLARLLGAEIHCLHAYNLANTADWLAPAEILASLQEEEEQRALEQMDAYHEQMKADAEQQVVLSPILRAGFAADVVAQVCRELSPDLVVMGTKGATNPIDRMLGSITSQVMNDIEVPILAVPQTATYSPVRRIAYATDFSEKNRSSLSVLGDLSKALQASVIAVTVIGESDELPDTPDQSALENRYRQDSGVDDLMLRFLHASDVAEALASFMETEEAEILAASTQHRGFLKSLFHRSLTRRLALYAQKPLLVFHS
jgi:nucleotide-binding universal stress UspA family protein